MRRAFTLVELLVVNVVVVGVIGVLQPAVGGARGSARNVVSQMNMRSLGAGGMGYASDNAGAIYSLDLDVIQQQIQAIEILSRLTGRPIDASDTGLKPLTNITPNRRYQHLVLMDYLGAQLPEPITASPFDRNLIQWQADPVLAQSTTVPYVEGSSTAGRDKSSNWATDDVRQMWAYGSTYQVVPAAWNPNNDEWPARSWTPAPQTPHLFYMGTAQQRYMQQVAFPSKKVHLFEEFDRASRGDALWFAYPEARCNLQFFDGSVRRMPSKVANPGWNPDEPDRVWKQRYKPLDKFPMYASGHSNREEMHMTYRWTREGLGGIDFGGKDVYPSE